MIKKSKPVRIRDKNTKVYVTKKYPKQFKLHENLKDVRIDVNRRHDMFDATQRRGDSKNVPIMLFFPDISPKGTRNSKGNRAH